MVGRKEAYSRLLRSLTESAGKLSYRIDHLLRPLLNLDDHPTGIGRQCQLLILLHHPGDFLGGSAGARR